MFSSRDLLIKQRIQTLLSDHAKANGQLYLPDDRRIYFHYFKGWKERFLFRGNLLLPIFVRFYEKRNCLYTFWYYILFMYNRIKKIWIEEKEWYMRIILTTSYIATSFVIEWPLRFSIKWSYHWETQTHYSTLSYWMSREGMVWSSIGYPIENIAN